MEKKEIIDLLEKKHQDVFLWIENQPEENWNKQPEGKWSLGQHILHLVESLELLNKGLSYPKFILKYKFGKSNRPTRSYDEVAKRYQEKLSANQERAKEFNSNLKNPSLKEKQDIIERLKNQNQKLQQKTNKWNNSSLDVLLLPHPLMGKMTIREIMMWTAYHTEHHATILKTFY